MRDVVAAMLSEGEARSLTDEVKRDAEALWLKLAELYDRGAHRALNYGSWHAYCDAEFGVSQAAAYRLLSAGRTLAVINSDNGLPVPSQSQAHALAPLLNEPETLREVWAEASANGTPTVADVREAVGQHRPRLTLPLNEEELARQQRETLIRELDRAVFSLESPPSAAEAEAKRLLAEGNPGPFTPSRFDRVAEYAKAFARTLREAGIDG